MNKESAAELMLMAQHGSRFGLLVDHVPAFLEAGGRLVREWAVLEDGRAFPLLCGDLVWVDTEDGPVDGRCLARAHGGACERHRAERDAWRELSDAEQVALEREEDFVS